MLEFKMQHQSGSCAPSSVCMILLQPLEHLWFASKICPEWGNGHFQTGIMAQVVDLYLAVSSQRSYRCAQTCFMEFCQRLNIPPLPAAKQLMLLFVAELSQRLWHSSVWSYLSAVRHLHISKVVGGPIERLIEARVSVKKPTEIQSEYKENRSANHSVHNEDRKRCVGERPFELWEHSVMGNVFSGVLHILCHLGKWQHPRVSLTQVGTWPH